MKSRLRGLVIAEITKFNYTRKLVYGKIVAKW